MERVTTGWQHSEGFPLLVADEADGAALVLDVVSSMILDDSDTAEVCVPIVDHLHEIGMLGLYDTSTTSPTDEPVALEVPLLHHPKTTPAEIQS